jgi:hypothetical protein
MRKHVAEERRSHERRTAEQRKVFHDPDRASAPERADTIKHATIIHSRYVTRLVRQKRFDGCRFINNKCW